MQVRFGVLTPQNVPWEELLGQWRTVEELGFDSVRVADHWVDFIEPHQPWFDAWALLGALASHTGRIRLGPLISPVAFHNPAFLARRAATIDHISSGRLELGLGTGIPGTFDPSYSMAGLDDLSGRERVARLGEAVTIIDSLFRHEVTTFEGTFYRVHDAVLMPQPVQTPRPPITIAAFGPAMLDLTARHADTWSFMAPVPPMTTDTHRWISQMIGAMDDACRRIDRDPSSLRRSLLVGKVEETFRCPSEGEFTDMVEQLLELGISEIIMPYPSEREDLPRFERVATGIIPSFLA